MHDAGKSEKEKKFPNLTQAPTPPPPQIDLHLPPKPRTKRSEDPGAVDTNK